MLSAVGDTQANYHESVDENLHLDQQVSYPQDASPGPQERRADRPHPIAETLSKAAILVSGLSLVVSLSSAAIAWRQARTAERALVITNRPYVVLQGVVPQTGILFQSMRSPSITLRFSGKSPATDLAVFAKMYAMAPDAAPVFGEVYRRRDKICVDAATHWHSGAEIGAGEPFQYEDEEIGVDIDDLAVMEIRALHQEFFVLVGCVIYGSTFDDQSHETSFAYVIERKDPDHSPTAWFIPNDQGDFDLSQVEIRNLQRDKEINN